MTAFVLSGVYAPQDDTELLVQALRQEPLPPQAAVLDVGTGTGAVALAAARRGAQVTAVDISWRAALNTKANAVLSRLPVRVVRGNLLTPVAGRSFDLILTNSPYVPAPAAAVPRRGAARAWDAGYDGRLVLDRICQDAPALLRAGGVLLLAQSALSGADETQRRLRAAGLSTDITARRSIAFGPVLRSRRDWLRSRGLMLTGAGTDDEKEELVIIRAENIC